MPINIKGGKKSATKSLLDKSKKSQKPAVEEDAEEVDETSEADEPEPQNDEDEEETSAPKSKKKGSGSMSFLKSGAAAKKALANEEAKAEAKKAEYGKLWRFYMKEDEEKEVIFLDGELDEDGSLDVPMWHEHVMQVGGKWRNLPCTKHEEPCPMCDAGDEPSLMAGLTVLDLTPFTIKKGPNAGKKIKYSKKIYACKRTTFAQLQKFATKMGGLVGQKFEISRSGSKVPNVGDTFIPLEKIDFEELHEKYKDDAEPADFSEEITYHNRKELIQLGVKAAPMVGGKHDDGEDLDDELGG